MALKDLVIQSQLIPPRQRKGVLRRPRLEARLAAVLDHPLTLVQAGTGYGKSTTLAALAGAVERLFWYTITEPDTDPLLFLAHLICAFDRQVPAWSEPALRLLEKSGGRVTPDALTPLLNALTVGLDGEAVLVLDDYHLVGDVPEIAALVERLVDYLPPRLHVVIASRQLPTFASLTRWRVKGQVLTITRADLAFTPAEIAALFREQYGHPLSSQQAQALATETEGWAIALQMVWQGLQSGAIPDLAAVLGHLPSSLEALFDYLAQEVLARQPPDVPRFLLTTAVLRQMNGAACDHLLEVQGSQSTLRWLHESGLFVVSLGDDEYRYQRLFHDFLQAQLARNTEQAQALHRRAADHFRQTGHLEETVYHLLEAQEHTAAAQLLEEIGPGLVRLGRLDSLSGWIARLPEEVRVAHPGLDLLLGDVLRLRAHFDDALEHYAAAEHRYVQQRDRLGRSRALRGQAQVYLDTVRPLKAESLLEEALRLLEPQEHRQEAAALLDQLAENKLNLGYPDEAQALHHEARLLRTQADPGDVYLDARAMVRTGRLAEGRRRLEEQAEKERQADQSRAQRFHRETVVLLSLICALQGDGQAAERYAREGMAIGQRLESPFVEAVGTMRLGHALQLCGFWPWDDRMRQQAINCYHRAIEQVRVFEVMRVQVEPLWGLCRAHGYAGDLAAAQRYAQQALIIARRAGDEWGSDVLQVTLGASFVLAGRPEQARHWLNGAAEGFAQVGDPFGRSAAWLWLALNCWWQGDVDGALGHLSDLVPLARERGYDGLLTRCTHLGLKDDQAAVPLLIAARRQGIETAYADRLLREMDLVGVEYHPGYTLSVRTLGTFAAWRGDDPVTSRDWQREKARQIFQLLLTHRGQWLHREQIVDRLWPHLGPEAALRDFKVALSTLNRALEPGRPRGAQPFFVARREDVYRLNPTARLAVDADYFEQFATSDDVDTLRWALSLYEDDYLLDSLYEDWPAATRERLRQLYLTAAERLARLLIEKEAWDEAIEVCQSILSRDDTWEAAYRLLMRAYAAQGNRPHVHQVYQRCVATLSDELGVEPSPATQTLFERLSQ
ncbi:MAG: transcriptional regulator [Chloroflexi bacterium]|nr:transcriptional regulator [Chloroflexota bacterium]